MECFKCSKKLKEVFEGSGERCRQYSDSIEFVGVGAYGSIYDMCRYSLQICDRCLKDEKSVDDYFEEKEVEFKCKHCSKISGKLLRCINGLFCNTECRLNYSRLLEDV